MKHGSASPARTGGNTGVARGDVSSTPAKRRGKFDVGTRSAHAENEPRNNASRSCGSRALKSFQNNAGAADSGGHGGTQTGAADARVAKQHKHKTQMGSTSVPSSPASQIYKI